MKIKALTVAAMILGLWSTAIVVRAQRPTPTPTPQTGFKHQALEPSTSDPLSKLIVTIPPTVEKSYDRFEDKTTVWVPYDWVYVRDFVDQNLRLTAFFTFRGKAAAGTPIERMGLLFRSTMSEWTYLKSNNLDAIIDGERISFGRPFAKDSDIDSSSGYVRLHEVLEFKISYDELKKIANARRVEMRLGPAEFDLRPSFIRSIQKLIAGLVIPTKPTPAKRRLTKKSRIMR